VRTPAAKELADAARSKESTLATVVARSVTLQTESAPPQDDLITFDNTPPPTTTIHATTVVARKPASDPQQTFSLGEEDRGRFKDTEPSIVQGEDLDVPTWMRLKKKLRR
jgi:cell division protein FtsZ